MQEAFQKFILQPDSTKSKITTQSKLCTSGGLPLNSARPIITSNSLHTPHVILFHFSAVVLSFHILFIFHVNLYDYIEPFLVAREVPSRKNFLWIMHKHYFTQLSEKTLQNCWQIYYFNAAPKNNFFLQTKKRENFAINWHNWK